jgi:integrase
VVAYAGVHPETHQQRQKWFGGFASRKEAEQFRQTLSHHPSFSAGQGPYGSPRLRTGDYLIAWVKEGRALGTLTSRTADHTEGAIRHHLMPHIGHIPLSRLGPPAIQHLYILLLEQGLAPATVRRSAGILHVALEEAVERGLILRNPQDNTKSPRVPRYQPTVLTSEEIVRYLDDARQTATPAVFAVYVTAAACGLRIGELLGLPEDAADLARRVLTVRRSLVEAGPNPVYKEPKTASGVRTVLLPDVAVDAIRAALTWKKQRRLMMGAKYRDAGLLFCGPRGRPLNPSNIRTRDHLPRLERLGMPRTRLHDFRHFHATSLVAAGVDTRTVADRLGHASPSFTLATYAHANAEAQIRAAVVANELLMKSGPVAR